MHVLGLLVRCDMSGRGNFRVAYHAAIGGFN